MQNLEYLKKFIEEKAKGIYVEVNLIDKATVRPPCIILEPIRNRRRDKNKILHFRVIFVDIEVPYDGVLEFGRKTEDLLDNMENHEVFEGNFYIQNREINWDIFEGEGISYYKAIAEYEIDETRANIKDLEEYLMMKELKMEVE